MSDLNWGVLLTHRILYLVCSTCYNENGPKFLRAGQAKMWWFTCHQMQNGEVCVYSNRAPHMPSIAPFILIIVIIAKNGISKTSSNYDKLYTARISFACRFRIRSQNIKLEPTWSVIAWFILKCVIEHWFNHNKSFNC